MAKAELHPTDGFSISGWMVTDLHLTGAELLTFALVHQFAQSKAGVYKGNTSYLSAWTGWTDKTCRKHLAALVEKGLLTEARGRENNVPYCFYELTDEFYKKHPVKITESPGNNFQSTRKNLPSTTGKKLPGEYNNKEENIENRIPPTPQQVEDYVRGRGFSDPEGFAEYYCEINNNREWKKKNGEPILNWKNNIITNWESRHKNDIFPKSSNPAEYKPFDLNKFRI